MLVHILGKTPQEKGLQLEELVNSVLKVKGYSNLVKRQISSGGHEIDIYGEMVFKLVSKPQTISVICECKAHDKPVNTTDWLKFLGKIYVEESNANGQVSGCFISLSGVNGNVWGSYKQLKENKRDNIELITGEGLEVILREIFSVPENFDPASILAQQTSRKILSISLAYYAKNLYWVFSLHGDSFTILENKGNVLMPDDDVVKMLREITPGEYIDLNAEREILQIEKAVERYIYVETSNSGGIATVNQLREDLNQAFDNEGKQLNDDIFDRAIFKIMGMKFIKTDQLSISLSVEEIENRVLFFKRLLEVGISAKILSSRFYENLFDRRFLDEVQRIQCGLIIDEDSKDICLKTISLSPSALATVINEILMITHHRNNQPFADAALEEHDKKYFLRVICEKLMQDFENPILTDFYFNHVGMEELDFRFDVRFKTRKGIHIEHQNRKRSGIARVTEELGGGLVRILALDNAPEPWERYRDNR